MRGNTLPGRRPGAVPDTRPRFALLRAWSERELLWNLFLRDLRTRYRRNAIGWAWSMINPAVLTLIYTFVFTQIFPARPPAGIPSGMKVYSFYLLSGLLPWNALVNGVTAAAAALSGGGGLMAKVRFSREHLVLAPVLAMIVTLLIELSILAGIELVAGYVTFHLVPVVLLLTVLLTLFISGLALMIAALNLRYRDVQHLTSIGFLVWFYLTPVIYPASLLPKRSSIGGLEIPVRAILSYNPMSRFLLAYRSCFFDITLPGSETMAGLVVISVATFGLGYRFFIRRAPWFVEDL